MILSNLLLDTVVTIKSTPCEDIKPNTTTLLFDKLFEQATLNFYFELLKYFIEGKYANLNNIVFKKFFILCGKC